MIKAILLTATLLFSPILNAQTVYLNIPGQYMPNGKWYPPESIKLVDFADKDGWQWCAYSANILHKLGASYTFCSIQPLWEPKRRK